MVGPRKVKLLGRADDMVIMGGVKESPLVLEDTLRTGAGIKDAAVVGIKASDGGDLVCVALVLTDDANVEVIRAGIQQLWAVYKVRIIIAVVDDLARTENGKVSRAKVRDFFREQLEAEVAAS
jgi:long-chain acyl-CoA synthetase